MKTSPLPCLGGFVVGVFIGAGLWLPLILCVALVVAWKFRDLWLVPDRPSRPIKHVKHFGPRPRGGGH